MPEQIHFFSLITELLQYVASGSNQVATAQAASELCISICINVFLLLQVGDIQHDWLQELYKVSLIYQIIAWIFFFFKTVEFPFSGGRFSMY